MSDFVLDASVTLTWFLDDEQAPQADVARAGLIKDRAFVPHLWRLEVRNGLIMAKRRDAALASLGGALTRAAALEGVQLVDQ